MVKKELLKVEGLKQYFPIKGGIMGRTVNFVKAVDDISFTIYEGETVSIVGESGCGKSTERTSAAFFDKFWCFMMDSLICWPTVKTGFRDVIGS